MVSTSKAQTYRCEQSQHDFEIRFQGAIIDEFGNEIPITEAMIQTACRQLDWRPRAAYPTSILKPRQCK